MKIALLEQSFSICKLPHESGIDFSRPFCFVGKTDEELSLVCETAYAPAHAIAREDGWRCFRIQGVLDFSMVGVLAGVSSLLAKNGISIFAVSTYLTDYLFTKEENFRRAVALLAQEGYSVDEAFASTSSK
ncbi:MAG: ACT domain-containing protein [Christensenella sp.]|nr:ACT domain-containing protein [Christensenella sp.]